MSVELLRDLARAKAVFQLRALETIIRSPASCDERPTGLRPEGAQGQRPASAVGSEADETPSPLIRTPGE